MWFYEKLFPEIRLGVQGELLYKTKTAFQNLKIFNSNLLGKMLVLDDIIQTTEKDEFIYHEMMTHPLLLAHPEPENILIIGAGDGGILREVLKHRSVKKAFLVEIDEKVISVSKKYLPSLSLGAFNDKRARVIIDDGAKFVRETKEKFDIAIVDSSDPIGPATVLFADKFYKDLFSVLKEGGFMIRQTGSTLFQPQEAKNTQKMLIKIFPYAAIQVAAVPTYIGGLFSFVIASKKFSPAVVPFEKVAARYEESNLKTKYYNPEIHFSSLQIPNYLRG